MNVLFDADAFPRFLQSLSAEFAVVKNLSFGLCLLFFVFALVIEQLRAGMDPESGQPWIVIKRLLFFVIVISAYEPLFEVTAKLCEAIALRIFSHDDLQAFMDELLKGFSTQEGKTSLLSLLRGGVVYVIYLLSAMFAAIAFYFLSLLRVVALGFLYLIGPLWLVVSLLPGRGKALESFLQTVLVVNAWIIVYSVLMKLMGLIAKNVQEAESGPVLVIAINIILGIILLATPTITSSIASGATLGGLPLPSMAMTTTRDLVWTTLLSSKGSLARLRNVFQRGQTHSGSRNQEAGNAEANKAEAP